MSTQFSGVEPVTGRHLVKLLSYGATLYSSPSLRPLT